MNRPEPPASRGTSSWLGRGGWALLDQALFSASNWLVHVLLVRGLPDEHAYGAFSVAFTWFLLIGTFHTSLLVEPMLVFGPHRFATRLSRYLGVLVRANFILGAIGAVVLAAVGLVYHLVGQSQIAVSCWSIAAASPFVFFLWLIRRGSYVRLMPRTAAIAGIGYLVAMVGGMGAILAVGRLSVVTAMGVMGASCLGAGLWLAWQERVRVRREPNETLPREAYDAHLRYGRWATASGIVMFIPGQIYYFLLPMLLVGRDGVEASGALRAMNNIFLPLIQANSALVVLLLPSLVSARDAMSYRRLLRTALLVMAGAPALFWLAAGLLHVPIMRLLYDSRFDGDAWLLWILGIQPVLAGALAVLNSVLASKQRPDRVFFASAASTVFALTIGLLLAWRYGLTGVAVAGVGSLLINVLFSAWFVRRLPEQGDEETPAAPHVEPEAL